MQRLHIGQFHQSFAENFGIAAFLNDQINRGDWHSIQDGSFLAFVVQLLLAPRRAGHEHQTEPVISQRRRRLRVTQPPNRRELQARIGRQKAI